MATKLQTTVGVYGGLGVYGGGGVYRSASMGAFKHEVMQAAKKIEIQFSYIAGMIQGIPPTDPLVMEINEVYAQFQDIMNTAMGLEDNADIANKDRRYYTGTLLSILDYCKDKLKGK